VGGNNDVVVRHIGQDGPSFKVTRQTWVCTTAPGPQVLEGPDLSTTYGILILRRGTYPPPKKTCADQRWDHHL